VGLGKRLRSLWHLKAGVVVSLLVSLVAAVWSIEEISLSPPGLESRSFEMATASTHVIVDTPTSTLVDLRQDAYSVEGLKNRAVLLGNVIASSGVQAKIAERARVPVELLRVQAPLTRAQAAPPVDSENTRTTSDILKTTEQYRIDIKANVTVPMLDIYAQAPDAETAEALANGAVDELNLYLEDLAASQKTPRQDQIRPVQLGRATGVVINGGVRWQVAILVFALTLAASCATVIFISRVRAGWRQAALAERPAEV
jgi:hypothetical protein